MVCFKVFVGSLSADDLVCVFVLHVVWVRRPALGAAGSQVMMGLGCRWGVSCAFSLINTPWSQEFSCSPIECPGLSTPIPEA